MYIEQVRLIYGYIQIYYVAVQSPIHENLISVLAFTVGCTSCEKRGFLGVEMNSGKPPPVTDPTVLLLFLAIKHNKFPQ
jgi:hypothetical protein